MALNIMVINLEAYRKDYNQLEKGRFQHVGQLIGKLILMDEWQRDREEKSMKDHTYYNTIEDIFNQYSHRDIPAGTQSLMVGMLHQAQKDLENPKDSRSYQSAARWVNARKESDYFLSFEFICNSFGLNVETAREKIYRVATLNREDKERKRYQSKQKRSEEEVKEKA